MRRFLRMSYLVASVAGVLFFAMSVALLAIWPGRVLEDETRRMSPEHPLGMTASQLRGRTIYSREGCAYCHTQQIRYLETDMRRFGAPTLAWETRLDYPHLWGTRRIGPDLAREGSSHSSDWQLAHLFAPRSVVAESVMPAYAALFDGSPMRPRQDALDLLSYIESLGRAREIAGPEGEARARAGCNCADDEMAQMAFHAVSLNANPEKPRRAGNVPKLSAQGDLQKGRELYVRNCASCHGMNGTGDGPGAASLRPLPANLAEHEYTLDRVASVLWNGVAGSSMPAWRDFPPEDLAALARTVQAFHVAQPEPNLPPNVLELGAKVYAANCKQCHGENGAGDGTAALQFPLAPANLRGQRPTLAQAVRALRNGVEGTEMAPWTGRLSEAELSAVAFYVRGFYAGGGAR